MEAASKTNAQISKAKDMLPFPQVFAHGMVFFVQALIFTICNAVYHEVFVEANILTREEEQKTPLYVGYFTGAFFVGKIISDFIWGFVRDAVGDKACINITSLSLVVALLVVGFSWNLISMMIFVFFVGLASGIFVPGLAFCNWIEVEKRDKLVMYMYLFTGAGTLTGPFIGSMLFNAFTQNRMPKVFGVIALINLFAIFSFNYAFSDYDDKPLIQNSEYSKLLEVETEKVRKSAVKEADSELLGPSERVHSEGNIDLRIPSDNLQPADNDSGRLDVSITDNLKFIENRQKMTGLTAYQMISKSSARMNLVAACGVTWGVKLLDWVLFPTWVEVSREKGGLGLSTVQTGSINLLSFPITSILLVFIFRKIKIFKSSIVLHVTNIIMLLSTGIMPVVYFVPFKAENLLFVIVLISTFKETSYIIWITSWTGLFSKMFPSKYLGQIYSWSFMLGHILLAFMSQIYPRMLTFFLESPKVHAVFGSLNVMAFFFLLVLPTLSVNFMIKFARKQIYLKERVLI
jgi:MFS family permease